VSDCTGVLTGSLQGMAARKGVLPCPFTPEELTSALQRVLEKRDADPESR
jgi:hypothetical protein